MIGRDKLAGAVLLIAVACGGGSEGVDAGGGPDADPEAPDGASADAGGSTPCDPMAQSGCGPEEKCSIIPAKVGGEPSEIGCVPNTGAGEAFALCNQATHAAPDDCARGLACVGATAPRCLPFCADYPVDTCGPGQVCAFGVDLDADWLVDVSFCAVACDLFAQDCEDPQFACYPTSGGSICALVGAGDTPTSEGAACDYANSCEEGLGCFRIGVSLEWLCFAVCDPYGTGGPTCGLDQSCIPVEDESWGLCQDDA